MVWNKRGVWKIFQKLIAGGIEIRMSRVENYSKGANVEELGRNEEVLKIFFQNLISGGFGIRISWVENFRKFN